MRESSPNPFSANREVGNTKSQLTPYPRGFYPQVLTAQYFARTPGYPAPANPLPSGFYRERPKKIL